MINNDYDFLKSYYDLLKEKNASDIGKRFESQLKLLLSQDEISNDSYKIVSSCLVIGESIGKDLNDESLEIIKKFINIGIELKEEQDSKKTMKELSKEVRSPKFSGSLRGGC